MASEGAVAAARMNFGLRVGECLDDELEDMAGYVGMQLSFEVAVCTTKWRSRMCEIYESSVS